MPQVMKEVIWWQPEDLQRFVAMAEMERRFGTVNLNTSVSLDSADDEEARPYRPTPSAPRDVVGAAGREPAAAGPGAAAMQGARPPRAVLLTAVCGGGRADGSDRRGVQIAAYRRVVE